MRILRVGQHLFQQLAWPADRSLLLRPSLLSRLREIEQVFERTDRPAPDTALRGLLGDVFLTRLMQYPRGLCTLAGAPPQDPPAPHPSSLQALPAAVPDHVATEKGSLDAQLLRRHTHHVRSHEQDDGPAPKRDALARRQAPTITDLTRDPGASSNLALNPAGISGVYLMGMRRAWLGGAPVDLGFVFLMRVEPTARRSGLAETMIALTLQDKKLQQLALQQQQQTLAEKERTLHTAAPSEGRQASPGLLGPVAPHACALQTGFVHEDNVASLRLFTGSGYCVLGEHRMFLLRLDAGKGAPSSALKALAPAAAASLLDAVYRKADFALHDFAELTTHPAHLGTFVVEDARAVVGASVWDMRPSSRGLVAPGSSDARPFVLVHNVFVHAKEHAMGEDERAMIKAARARLLPGLLDDVLQHCATTIGVAYAVVDDDGTDEELAANMHARSELCGVGKEFFGGNGFYEHFRLDLLPTIGVARAELDAATPESRRASIGSRAINPGGVRTGGAGIFYDPRDFSTLVHYKKPPQRA